MAFTEKPPILTGRTKEDMGAIRDYLFRMAQSINEIVPGDPSSQTAVKVSRDAEGRQVLTPVSGGGGDADLATVRKNAQELKALIIKSAENLQKQIDEIEFSTFYVKYADDFAGDYPATMYNTPTENTYYMGVCSSTSQTAPTDPSVYEWSRIKGDGGTGLNSATVFLYRRALSPPTKPQVDLTYTFASGRLDLGPTSVQDHTLLDADATVSGHKITFNTAEIEGHSVSVTGWTQEIPDSDGRPCWVITATAIATTATDTIAASEWSDVKKLVEDGENGTNGADGQPGAKGDQGDKGDKGDPGNDGADGLNGYNTAIVYLYRRSASEVTVDWQDSLTYSFPNKALTTAPQNWYKYPPSGDDPLYVTAATASSRENTDSIAANEWSSPVVMAENGTDGIQGPTGADGRTTYLHIKYSDDGQTFTPNQGEDLGAFIGMYTDFNIVDSLVFSDYEWHRFADDTELNAKIENNYERLIDYCDSKVEEYNSLYVAQSEFGTFQETIQTTITNTARGVVESYDYGSSIESMQDSIGLMQSYYTDINGEIRRGIIEDPDHPGEYVTGIAIAQALKFSGECGPSDQHNPGDGYTYYYLNSGQTFGLYTSVGWQFWIDGYKKGWFSSEDGMLHVASVYVEVALSFGGAWRFSCTPDRSEFSLDYTGS